MVQVYSTLSVALWWFMLIASLLWKIWFPYNAKMCQTKHQIKYIHIGCGLAGFLIPFTPIIAHMASFAQRAKSDLNTDFVSGGLGFIFVRFPPLPCNGNSKVIAFYTNILPSDLILAAGITLILLIFWLVHRVSVLIAGFQYPEISFSVQENDSEMGLAISQHYFHVTNHQRQ